MEIKVKVFGYTGEQLKSLAKEFIGGSKIAAEVSEIYLDASLSLTNQGEDERRFTAVTSDLLRSIKDNVYGEDCDTLGKRAIDYLTFKDKKLAVAESLTGGLIGDAIVAHEGASAALYEDLVTYSNESKIKRLGVSRFTLDTHGAVSYECAYEMANGLLKNMDVDIALSTTGIAGPSGASAAKPLGLTYIGVADRTGTKVYDHVFEGDRNTVRILAANTALFYLIDKLKNA